MSKSRNPGSLNVFYFINIYLTKTGIPAENEEDQQKWLTMSYEDVLTIIEQQSRRCNLSGRSSMIIEDYIETLRRHIVDNNDLHEKCVEIYRKHKQALDLIYEHKPDQLYVLYEYISEWAKLKHNQGQIVFVPEKSNKTYIRFKTNKLSQILPDSSYGKSGWNSNNFYFYEVYNYIDNEGKNNFRIQLEFSFTDSIPTELRKKCEMLNRIVTPNSKPIKQWRVVFHGKTKKYDSENGELDKALVWKDLDEQFDSIIKKETDLIEKWNGM